MHIITPIKRIDILFLLIIILIASWTRLGRGQVVEYFHDDAMLATLALEMADGEHFPLTGILSSTGIPNPPISVYVMAIPFSLSPNPNIAIQFVMILNIIGVGILWLIAHRYFGRTIAIISALLYTVNPWAILFSRKIWAQDFHTPFILLGILLLLYGFYEIYNAEHPPFKKHLAQILCIPILLFAFQIHFAAWAIAPMIPIVLWSGRKQIQWRNMVLSALLSVIVVAPYGIGLIQTLEQDPTRISDAADRSTHVAGTSISSKPIIDSIYLSSGTGLETWVAPDQQIELSATYSPLIATGLLITLIMPIGLFALWRQSRVVMLCVVIWAFLPQAVLIPGWTPVYIHYFIPSIPAMILLSAIGISFIIKTLADNRIVIGGIIALIGLTAGVQIHAWHTLLDYVEKQHIPYPGFTTPIQNLNTLRDTLKLADDVLIISQGMSWNLHHEVAVWDTLLWEDASCVRTMVADGYAVFPDHPFTVVVAPDAPVDPVNNLYKKTEQLIFDTRQGENGYIVYQWDTVPEWSKVEIQPINLATFDNGIQLTGYALQNNMVYLEWRLPAQAKGKDYQYTAQIFDASGDRIGQLDRTFWHGRHWCENDRLITWGDLSITSDATMLKVGMYQLGTGKNIGQFYNADVLDTAGNPIGQSIDIELN